MELQTWYRIFFIDSFFVNNMYEFSGDYVDKYYLLPMLEYFKESDNIIEVNGDRITVKDKVYFLEKGCGLIVVYLTDSGIFAEMRTKLYDSIRSELLPLKELLSMKKEYEHTLKDYKEKMAQNGYENAFDTYYQSKIENFHNYVFENGDYIILPLKNTSPQPSISPSPTEPVENNPDVTDKPQEKPMTESEPAPNSTPTPAPTQNADWQSPVLYIAIGCVLLVTVGICVFCFLGKKKNK